jgi:hypothetical protein
MAAPDITVKRWNLPTVGGKKRSQPDSTAPSVPSNLGVIDTTPVSVLLSWDPSTDTGSGMGRYVINRNGTDVATINAKQADGDDVTSYLDTGLQSGVTYTYKVKARDIAGNDSAYSSTTTGTTETTTPVSPALADDWSSGTINTNRWNTSVNGAVSPSNVLLDGSRRCKFEVRRSSGSANYRCELRAKTPGWDGTAPIKGRICRLGMRVRLASPYASHPDHNLVMQMHKMVGGTAGASQPMISLSAIGGNWEYVRRWSPDGTQGMKTERRHNLGSYSTDIGNDVDWAFYWVLDYDTNGVGYQRIDKNGVTVLDLAGGNAYRDAGVGYFKFGLYISQYQTVTGPDRIVHHDDIRIFTNDGPIEDAYPGWGAG